MAARRLGREASEAVTVRLPGEMVRELRRRGELRAVVRGILMEAVGAKRVKERVREPGCEAGVAAGPDVGFGGSRVERSEAVERRALPKPGKGKGRR